jgi:hypothetical protein
LFARVEVKRSDSSYIVIAATIVLVLMSWYGWIANAIAG